MIPFDATVRRVARLTLATGWIGLTACGGDSPAEESEASAAVEGALPATLQELSGDTLFQIGAAQGESWQSFGGIWDVDVSPTGYIALLDIDAVQAHVYGPEGAHVGSISARGVDEGALEGPSGLAWRGPDDLLVWDPGSSWISQFGVASSGVQFEERWRAYAFGETGFCANAERTYLSYWQDSLVVHEVGPDGIARSFGAAPEIPGMSTLGPELQEIAVEELSPSGLLCTPQGVLDVSMFGSRVRFHDSAGTHVWEKDFEEFIPLVVATPDGMGLERQFDAAQGTHLLTSVVRWGDEHALIQHEIRTQEFVEEGQIPTIESRLIRLADGAEIDRTRELPHVLATWGQRLYLVMDEPFSRLVVLEAN